MAKERYVELDIAKGIGSLLVIMGHIQYISTGFRAFIVSFHIPLFFVAAGMLIYINHEDEKRLWETAKKKGRSILQPYVIFSILFLLIQLALYKFEESITLELIRQNIYLTLIFYGMSVLWFLAALFAGEMAFLGVVKWCKKKWALLVLAAWVLIACIANRYLQSYSAIYGDRTSAVYLSFLGQMILRIGIVAFFIGIGFYLWMFKEKITMTGWAAGLVGAACLGLTIVISQINGVTDLHYLIFHNEFLYFSGAVLGSIGVIGISYSLKEFAKFPLLKLLQFYGKNSLIVMLTHVDTYLMYFSTIIVMHFNKDILEYNGNVRFCTELFLLVTIAEGIGIIIINEWFPWMIGRKRGENKWIL